MPFSPVLASNSIEINSEKKNSTKKIFKGINRREVILAVLQ